MNKTLSNGEKEWIDGGHWNVYLPLKNMGHNVHFYDTVRGEEKSFSDVVDGFKPELIFCCMTGDPRIAPNEPWEELLEETKKGNCKTFNWFCDDTWRFYNFSSKVCNYFNVCSTPEKAYLEKFKKIGYDNIILGFWHLNSDFLPKGNIEKKHDITFCGNLNEDRKYFIDHLSKNGIDVQRFHGLKHKKMLETLAESRIGINFSKNFTLHKPMLQMKLRPVEVTAARSLLLTEYAPGIEEYFKIDEEIITFKSEKEMLSKTKFLLKNQNLIEKLANNGYERFCKEHESKIRLENIIRQIMEI